MTHGRGDAAAATLRGGHFTIESKVCDMKSRPVEEAESSTQSLRPLFFILPFFAHCNVAQNVLQEH